MPRVWFEIAWDVKAEQRIAQRFIDNLRARIPAGIRVAVEDGAIVVRVEIDTLSRNMEQLDKSICHEVMAACASLSTGRHGDAVIPSRMFERLRIERSWRGHAFETIKEATP